MEVLSMVKVEDDHLDDAHDEEQKERREKVPVLVRRHEHPQQEEASIEDGKDKKSEIPRSWYIY